MKPLEYKREVVLERLKTNREEHIREVKEAWDGYWTTAMDMLEKQIQRIEARKPIDQDAIRAVPEPPDYTKDYDMAIEQLEAAFGDLITLDDGEFKRFMLNEWSWRPQFQAQTANYRPS